MGSEIVERPILFSGEMVRAILEGRKSKTRRTVKPKPEGAESVSQVLASRDAPDTVGAWVFWAGKPQKPISDYLHCPQGKCGDRLWVRESHWRFTGCTFNGQPWDGFIKSPDGDPYNARCYDDYSDIEMADARCAIVRVPSIHMPRWASRIDLEITDIRVERLQDISEEDAIAEGFLSKEDFAAHEWCVERWADNPWVWVISFKRIEQSTASTDRRGTILYG